MFKTGDRVSRVRWSAREPLPPRYLTDPKRPAYTVEAIGDGYRDDLAGYIMLNGAWVNASNFELRS